MYNASICFDIFYQYYLVAGENCPTANHRMDDDIIADVSLELDFYPDPYPSAPSAHMELNVEDVENDGANALKLAQEAGDQCAHILEYVADVKQQRKSAIIHNSGKLLIGCISNYHECPLEKKKKHAHYRN